MVILNTLAYLVVSVIYGLDGRNIPSVISSGKNAKIVLGRPAEAHSIPYQAWLKITGNIDGIDEFWYCGGTLISVNYVLTSAYCGQHASTVYIMLGAQNISETENTQFNTTSEKIIVHPYYNYKNKKNDIALINLNGTTPLSRTIQTVLLPGSNEAQLTYEGRIGSISGWGLADGYDSEVSQGLNIMEGKIISNDECHELFNEITDTNICVSGISGSSACSADTGGPLTVDGVLIGIVSYHDRFCEEGFPSAFTRVTKYLEWIQENSDVTIKPRIF